MKEFNVIIEKNVSSLANILEILAKNAINIKAISTERKDGKVAVKLVTEDENSTYDILKKFNMKFEDHEIIPLELIDRPGELARVARLLSRSGINVESIYILGKNPEKSKTEIALRVEDMEKVKELLG